MWTEISMASNYVFLSVYIYHSAGFTLLPPQVVSLRNMGVAIQTFAGAQMFLREGLLILVELLKCSRFFKLLELNPVTLF